MWEGRKEGRKEGVACEFWVFLANEKMIIIFCDAAKTMQKKWSLVTDFLWKIENVAALKKNYNSMVHVHTVVQYDNSRYELVVRVLSRCRWRNKVQ